MIATVREWREEEGWGILTADETPGDIFAHFAVIQMEGYKSLKPGERVEVEVEGAASVLGGWRLPVRRYGGSTSSLIGRRPTAPLRDLR